MSSDATEIVRQLDEWRDMSAFWLKENAQAYRTNQAELFKLKKFYIQASAKANSLIDQLALQTVAKSAINPKKYAANVAQAKAATEALAQEGERLLLAASAKTRGAEPAKTRGAASTDSASQPTINSAGDVAAQIPELAKKTVALAGDLLDVLDKHKKAFVDLDTKVREEVKQELKQRRWKALEEHLAPAAESPKKP